MLLYLERSSTQYAEEYREASADARASYKSEVSFSNPILTISSSILIFFKYFAFPLPWQVSSVQDLVPLFENIIRLIIFGYIFKNRKLISRLSTLLIIYLLIEFIWALGTSNWGTGSRHHIISSQILIVIFIYLKDRVNKNLVNS